VPIDETPPTAAEHLTEDVVVLLALGEEVAPEVHAHLEACATCRTEVAEISRVVGSARSQESVVPVPVPAGTWENVARELGIDPAGSGAPAASAPVVVPLRRAGAPRPIRRTRWVPVAAAALIGLGVGALGTRALSGPAEPTTAAPPQAVVSTAALEPLAGSGSGSADVTEAGGSRRLELRISGVAAVPDGFLEAWLLDADGGLVPLGFLSPDPGAGAGMAMSVTLPADLDLGRFDVVDVSREPLDGNPGHSSDSVLRGTLTVRA
jgi:hypothetical protein